MVKETSKLKLGKFIPSKVYKVNVEMSNDINDFFVNLGKKVITDEQYSEIGMLYALDIALEEHKRKSK